MGNAVPLHCNNLCDHQIPNNILITNIEQKYFAIPTENGQNIEYLSNAFIKKNKFLHKSFQHFFIREAETVNNFQIVITPKKNNNNIKKNMYLTNDFYSTIKDENDIQKEREIDLNTFKSKINSIILNSENKESIIIDKNNKIENSLKLPNLKRNTNIKNNLTHSINDIEIHQLINHKKIKKEIIHKDNIAGN